MEKIFFPARAKINLSLDVLYKRPDGYHELEMVMQSISLSDMLIFSSRKDQEIMFTCDHPQVPQDESNIILRVVNKLKEVTGIRRGAGIHLEKNIPIGAGLAGGSTDAAASLISLNRLWELGLPREKLLEIGAELGADIPFCMTGGTCLARGKGEILTGIPLLKPMWVMLVVFNFSVSTAEIYENYRPEKVLQRPDTPSVIKALEKGDLKELRKKTANALESVTLSRYSQVAKRKEELLNKGFSGTLMTGSGPTLFYLSSEKAEIERAAQEVSWGEEKVIIARTV